ncbi:LiaF domain-containing protein [Ornithinimicrobium pekingense]|uniref:LiaF domain-containing protein n=1 Tax=Ornithinimicrobium pekingense TaxID=384677 RepID=UPI0012EB83DE|nr:LiaF domain-containing protein [Ornithinimicrobium pekingense]
MTYGPGGEQDQPQRWPGPSEVGGAAAGGPQDAPPPPPLPGPQSPGSGLPEVVPVSGEVLPPYRGAPPPARQEKSEPLVAFMGDIVRTGRWQAARRTNALQLMGDLKLDLREVITPGETLEVETWSLMGDVKIVVPPGTDVVVNGGTLLGDVKTETDPREPAQRTGARLVVRGYTLMGDVVVREMGADPGKPPRGWRWVNPKR